MDGVEVGFVCNFLKAEPTPGSNLEQYRVTGPGSKREGPILNLP